MKKINILYCFYKIYLVSFIVRFKNEERKYHSPGHYYRHSSGNGGLLILYIEFKCQSASVTSGGAFFMSKNYLIDD